MPFDGFQISCGSVAVESFLLAGTPILLGTIPFTINQVKYEIIFTSEAKESSYIVSATTQQNVLKTSSERIRINK